MKRFEKESIGERLNQDKDSTEYYGILWYGRAQDAQEGSNLGWRPAIL